MPLQEKCRGGRFLVPVDILLKQRRVKSCQAMFDPIPDCRLRLSGAVV